MSAEIKSLLDQIDAIKLDNAKLLAEVDSAPKLDNAKLLAEVDSTPKKERIRICLIHATPLSIAPIKAEFVKQWPEAQLQNILEDSLSADLKASGELTADFDQRFLDLAEYGVKTGADAILFTCSAFGRCIERVKAKYPNIPVLKPNEAMMEEAIKRGGKIGVIATFPPTIPSITREMKEVAAQLNTSETLSMETVLVSDAMQAKANGDAAHHDQLIADAAGAIFTSSSACGIQGCETLCLAQFSMASAADGVAAATGLPVLTSPGTAVQRLRSLLIGSN
jgi:Asp/Glu/hydantoin racemase